MPVVTRPSRRYMFVSGTGGSIQVQDLDLNGIPQGALIYFDVAQWIARLLYINKPTPHSGMNGGMHRTQVGHDWTFRCQLSFPAKALTGALEVGFAETLLGSPRGFLCKFNVGDPEFWTLRDLEPRNYRGPALLAFTEPDNSASGRDEVMLNVEGEGMGLLVPYLDDTPQPLGFNEPTVAGGS